MLYPDAGFVGLSYGNLFEGEGFIGAGCRREKIAGRYPGAESRAVLAGGYPGVGPRTVLAALSEGENPELGVGLLREFRCNQQVGGEKYARQGRMLALSSPRASNNRRLCGVPR